MHTLHSSAAGVLMFTDSCLSSLVWTWAAAIRCKQPMQEYWCLPIPISAVWFEQWLHTSISAARRQMYDFMDTSQLNAQHAADTCRGCQNETVSFNHFKVQTISSLVFLRFSCPIPSLENVTCKVVVSNDMTNSLVSLISISKLKTDSSLRFREWKQLQS